MRKQPKPGRPRAKTLEYKDEWGNYVQKRATTKLRRQSRDPFLPKGMYSYYPARKPRSI